LTSTSIERPREPATWVTTVCATVAEQLSLSKEPLAYVK
jgi:hypothetical protein